MTETMKTAVLGVGRLGSIHARIYSQLDQADLVAVVDPDEAKAREAAEKFGTRALTDPAELPADVRAVSVAAPTNLHAALGVPLLERGVHVLVEKPLASTIEEADRLLDAARRGGATLQVGHVERFNPAVMAAEKVIGVPLFIESHRLSPFSFRSADIDVILDLMIHDIDIIRHLVGSPLARVDAVGVSLLSGSEDMANARFLFQNGCVANVTASRMSAKKMRKLRVFSREGYLSLDYGEQRALLFQPTEQVRDGIDLSAVPPEALKDPLPYFLKHLVKVREIPFDEHEPLKKEIETFLEAARAGSAPVVTGEDGKAAMEIAAAVQASIREHYDRVTGKGGCLEGMG